MNHAVEYAEVVGSTLRLRYRQSPGPTPPVLHTVLLAGTGITSHYWLNILALSPDGRLRYYITEDDFAAMSDWSHVKPTTVPSFLVISDGYIVDWFPAPLPNDGGIHDPVTLLSEVIQRLQTYR
jgi:hypothetical protein